MSWIFSARCSKPSIFRSLLIFNRFQRTCQPHQARLVFLDVAVEDLDVSFHFGKVLVKSELLFSQSLSFSRLSRALRVSICNHRALVTFLALATVRLIAHVGLRASTSHSALLSQDLALFLQALQCDTELRVPRFKVLLLLESFVQLSLELTTGPARSQSSAAHLIKTFLHFSRRRFYLRDRPVRWRCPA